MSFLFNTICDDIIGMIIEEKKIIDETKKNKEKFDETIELIDYFQEETIVYWYRDGTGEKCPYYLWEFNCCEDDAAERNEEEILMIEAIQQQYDDLGIHILY